jgi:hypothetical protein
MKIESVRLLPGGQIVCIDDKNKQVQAVTDNVLVDLAKQADKQGYNLNGALCDCGLDGTWRFVQSGTEWTTERAT